MLEEEAPFPDVSAKLPEVILVEEEEGDYQVVTNEPDPAFETLAAVALENAGIDTAKRIRAARATADAAAKANAITQTNGPPLIEVNEDEIVYKIAFDLPDDGIIPDYDDTAELPDAAIADVTTKPNRYPTQSCRSVVGNQLYKNYTPQVQFLQLREVRAHRSALTTINEQKLHPGEVTMQQMQQPLQLL